MGAALMEMWGSHVATCAKLELRTTRVWRAESCGVRNLTDPVRDGIGGVVRVLPRRGAGAWPRVERSATRG